MTNETGWHIPKHLTTCDVPLDNRTATTVRRRVNPSGPRLVLTSNLDRPIQPLILFPPEPFRDTSSRSPGLAATGDGALGFWAALREVYAKQHLQNIWMAETKDEADKALDFFVQAYGPKYDKAVNCLTKDRDVLLTFYDFPAEHWNHLRTTNPTESTFATVRLRTARTKGCLSRKTALTMVFKLRQSASKKWRRLNGSHQLTEIIHGVKFKDGEKLTNRAA